MVLLGDTEKFAPLALEPIATPPEETVYQLMLLPAEVAFRLVLCPWQIADGVAVTLVGGVQGEETAGVMVIIPLPVRTPCVWITLVAPDDV